MARGGWVVYCAGMLSSHCLAPPHCRHLGPMHGKESAHDVPRSATVIRSVDDLGLLYPLFVKLGGSTSPLVHLSAWGSNTQQGAGMPLSDTLLGHTGPTWVTQYHSFLFHCSQTDIPAPLYTHAPLEHDKQAPRGQLDYAGTG